ncbi:riboflavin kinase / FMN adenylyltransferase [Eubacterium ruminantium]|nr:riboflavin kinase / FMN adenylyltransferase [Eubacterium ruminantium]
MTIYNDTLELNNAGLVNTAVTIGKFDGIHKGHQLLIKRIVSLKEEGLDPVVCMIDMNKKSIISAEDREEILMKMGVSSVVNLKFTEEFAKQTPEEFIDSFLIKNLGAKKIVVGNDFRFGHNREGNVNTLKKFEEKYDYSCEFYEKIEYGREVISSTAVRDAIYEGNMKKVKSFLGRNYQVRGRIIHGNHLGNTIGFPTINILFPEDMVAPRYGVYASMIILKGKTFSGVTNIGRKPTIGEYPEALETYIFDMNEDVYGEEAVIIPQEFIREEKKFDSVESLRKQLQDDIKKVKACNFC